MPARPAIFLDANAGAPLKPQVIHAVLPLLHPSGGGEGYPPLLPNPSSIHSHGRLAKKLVADAREKIAKTWGPRIDPEQVVVTSSGSESNQAVIRGVLEPLLYQGRKPHWITTRIEHDSTLQLTKWLESRGGSVSYLPNDSLGVLDISKVRELWRPETSLVSVVWVNNETGVIADVLALSREVEALGGGVLHVDAAQSWGKLALDLSSLKADFVTFSAHKIGAFAGTGFIWAGGAGAKKKHLHPLIFGKQEKGRRGGSENLIGIIAAGAAADSLDPEGWRLRVAPLRDRLENAICTRIEGTTVNGGGATRVANTLNLSFDGVTGDGLIMALDLAGFSVSSGSACSSGVLEPSHVLLAMGRSPTQAMSALRVSLADALPWEGPLGVGTFVDALEKTVERARRARAR